MNLSPDTNEQERTRSNGENVSNVDPDEIVNQEIGEVSAELFRRAHFLVARSAGLKDFQEGDFFSGGGLDPQIAVMGHNALVAIAVGGSLSRSARIGCEGFIRGEVTFRVSNHQEGNTYIRGNKITIHRAVDLEGITEAEVRDKPQEERGEIEADMQRVTEAVRLDLSLGKYSVQGINEGPSETLQTLKELQRILS